MIYKKTFGTPERFVPTAFAPEPKAEIALMPDEIAEKIAFSAGKRGVKLTLALEGDTAVYGFGLQMKEINHRGNKITLRCNADPSSRTGDSHAPVPFFVTDKGWGMYVDTARNAVFYCGSELNRGLKAADFEEYAESEFVDNTRDLYADKTRENAALTIEVPLAEGVDVYYFTGESILDIVSQYNMLGGGGCLPPDWGLGNFYRCCGRFNEDEVLEMAKSIRDQRIPCDMLGLEPGWQTRVYSCSYVWSEKFPHHKELLQKLTDMGYKVNLWEHFFVHPTAPVFDALLPFSADYYVWHGLVPDLSIQEAQDIYASHQRTLVEEGVYGFKVDECDGSDFTGGWSYPDCAVFPSGMDGEQFHHLAGMLGAQTLLKAMGERETYSEIRAMGALCSSYPFVLYSDLYDFDDYLRAVINSGFSGLLWSPEVRQCSSKSDLVRRIQLVAFSAQSLVNAWNYDHQPWLDFEAANEVREMFEMRMRLVPYIRKAFIRYKEKGVPPVRSLVCDYENARHIEDEFIFGDMIVAPIRPEENEREVWLPEGEWVMLFDKKEYAGGTFNISTDKIPVFYRKGKEPETAEVTQFLPF
ncbi:MAG: glycoside hydrolase [Clostridia bacterium]|nr:glycoside hydrolase [Clostridia bacterium]